jgi:signal transduction histidine kinase
MWDWERERGHHRQGEGRFQDDDFEDDDGFDEDAVDRELMSPEERVLWDARQQAERKVRLTRDLVKYGSITILLLIFVPPVGVGLGIFWGWKYFRRTYRTLVEPRMRERFVREEVEKQVHAELARERQDLEGEHARSMQELSASIAHEIRNPITAAKSLVQQMEEDPAAKVNVEYARVALEELSRVERSVAHLLRFARDEDVRHGELRLAEIVDSALESFRDRADRAGIEMRCELDTIGPMAGDPEKLRRVVINLVGNAFDALEGSGKPGGRIDVKLGENLAGTEVWLQVADDGPGMGDDARARLFTPFYTSKQTGTGLGLPICKKIVEAHDGSIEVSSEPGRGTEFLLTFPKRLSEGPR